MAELSADVKTSSLAQEAAEPLAEAVAIMERLRGPGGCPWDREQTFDSIKRHTLEETYEVFDAIERRAWGDLKDELGDLLLQVLFYSEMASEAGYFSIADVAKGLSAKLVRRHPHIFPVNGELVQAADAGAVLRNWEEIKRQEKKASGAAERSALEEVPRSMPGLMEAAKLGSKAAKAGFDWPSADGLFAKLDEEIGELRAAVEVTGGVAVAGDNTGVLRSAEDNGDGQDGGDRTRVSFGNDVEQELGDVLFTAVNLARHLKVDAESAVRSSSAKFRRRFAAMEHAARGFEGLTGLSPAKLEELWGAAKADEVGARNESEDQTNVRRENV
ncbi:MAG: nucleoside triphosphate pyrophosphohydrolase [Acidobacteriaceae bacterium]